MSTASATLPATTRLTLGLFHMAQAKPVGAAGAVIIAVMVAAAVLAPWVSPYNPLRVDYSNSLGAPAWAHPFGTDQLGRDLLSNVIWGARNSLFIALTAVAVGTVGGSLLGLVTGYLGGSFDLVCQRLMDALMAFPALLLAMAIVASLGISRVNLIFALSIVLVPTAVRVIRSRVLSVREHQYIDAAKAVGCSTGRILFVHIMPNCLAPFIIIATSAIAGMILAESSLSFLGLGTPPPSPSWGRVLAGEGRRHIQDAPWLSIFPGLAITLVVFGFNLLGDALRDLLDPRLRRV